MNIESIVIHSDIKDKLALLTDEEAGQLFKAIISYAEDGTTIAPGQTSGAVVMAFLFVRDQIERDYAKYLERQGKTDKRSEINRENANKRWEKTKQSKKSDGNANKCNGNAIASDCINNDAIAPLPISIPISKSIPNNKDSKAKRFTKPSIQDLKDYIQEKDLNVDPEAFFDYYESKGWIVGKSPMKDWKAALRNWDRKDYACQQQAEPERSPTQTDGNEASQDKSWGERF